MRRRRPSPQGYATDLRRPMCSSESTDTAASAAARARRRVPVMLETEGWNDYALIDSGNGRKLERYGALSHHAAGGAGDVDAAPAAGEWEAADAHFVGIGEDEADGPLALPEAPLGETWPMAYDGIDFLGRFTSFRHVGVFPEQASHWDWMKALIAAAGRPVKVLNLFGYTGLASLVAARGRRRGHPCRCLEEGDRLGAREPGAGRPRRPADPLDLRGRHEIRRARGAARQPLRRHHPRPAEIRARAEGRGLGPLRRPAQMMRACRGAAQRTMPLFLCSPPIRSAPRSSSIHELAARMPGRRAAAPRIGRTGPPRESGGRALSTSLFCRWSRAWLNAAGRRRRGAVKEITSLANPLVKDIRGLALKNREASGLSSPKG